MGIDDGIDLRNRIGQVAQRYAGILSADAARGAAASLNSRTGKTLRSFRPAVRTDRSTGWVYAFGFRARQSAFILNYGQSAATKSGGQVRQYTRKTKQGTTHTVRSHARNIRAGSYLNATMRKFTPRIASEMSRVGATAVSREMKINLE